jgi:hypothetical protein
MGRWLARRWTPASRLPLDHDAEQPAQGSPPLRRSKRAGETRDDLGRCYDFAAAANGPSKRAYLRYVELMLDLFQPAYLNVAVEESLLRECPGAASSLRVANAAYDAAKARSARRSSSFQIDHLYGYSRTAADQTARDARFESAYASLRG